MKMISIRQHPVEQLGRRRKRLTLRRCAHLDALPYCRRNGVIRKKSDRCCVEANIDRNARYRDWVLFTRSEKAFDAEFDPFTHKFNSSGETPWLPLLRNCSLQYWLW